MAPVRQDTRPTKSQPTPTAFDPPVPGVRRLQVFAIDPSADTALATARISRCDLPVRWEKVQKGPIGEYVEVVDVDPSSGCAYDPVDLEDGRITAQDGLAPSEGSPQFHQQMVYAVAMKTIENFERALGRPILWSPRNWKDRGPNGEKLTREQRYVARLRIYPHALREANAYYSPTKKSLLFGYFNAPTTDPREELPGGMVFTCLSHDVIAHEITHAILDGLHPRMLRPSNIDMLAFHEGFADIVAIFQHFTLPGLLLNQIQRTRGNLGLNNLLAELAGQFGRATKRGGALRNALGEFEPDGRRKAANPVKLEGTLRPHDRGAILVAAVFDAFLRIYEDRVADLRRIATEGSGILRPGDINLDLARRFAQEAVGASQRVLDMAVRALDYLPPVDMNFGDYLRALITADAELVPDDPWRHRVAFIEAFRERGIYPTDVRSLGEDSLCWRTVAPSCQQLLAKFMPPPEILRTMVAAYEFSANAMFNEDTDPALVMAKVQSDRNALRDLFLHAYWLEPKPRASGTDRDRRYELYQTEGQFAQFLYYWLAVVSKDPNQQEVSELGEMLGLDLAANAKYLRKEEGGIPVEVHTIRPTFRVKADGRTKIELLVVLTQKKQWNLPKDTGGPTNWADPEYEHEVDPTDLDEKGKPKPITFTYRGGCTLHIDPESGEIRYAVYKNISSARRRDRNAAYYRSRLISSGNPAMAKIESHAEPLALLHRDNDPGEV